MLGWTLRKGDCGLYNIGLIPLSKAGQGSAAGAGHGGASSAKGGETTCSGETGPQSLRVHIPQLVKASQDISIPVTDSSIGSLAHFCCLYQTK